MSQPAGERESAAVNGHDELPTVSESVDTKDADASVDDKDAMSERIGSLTARDSPQPTQFRIYKKRWIGLVGLFLINCINAMNAQWFAAIVVQSATLLETTLTQVNWFANVCNLTSLVSYLFVPSLCHKYDVRTLAIAAGGLNIVGAWIRYGGIRSAAPSVQWGIILFGQMINGLATPLSLALGATYSQIWFPLSERLIATMILTVSNPFGMALASVVSPLIAVESTDVALSVCIALVMGCVNLLHFVSFVVPSTPPIPPTYAASLPPSSFSDGFRLFLGDSSRLPFLSPPADDEGAHRSRMTTRERVDLWIVFAVYTLLVACGTALQVEIASVFMSYGYSSAFAGNVGGALILAGLVGAGTTAPLLDRYFKAHHAFAAKTLIPVIAAVTLSLIWVIKPANDIGIVAVFIVLGFASFALLPIGLELGAEITRQPEASSSAFYWLSTLLTFAMTSILDATRASDEASPPQNMDKGIILEVALTTFAAVLIMFLKGDQRRSREDSERLDKESNTAATNDQSINLPALSAH